MPKKTIDDKVRQESANRGELILQELPDIREIPKMEDKVEAARLMEEAIAIQSIVNDNTKALDEVKDRLEEIQKENGFKGFQYSGYAFYSRKMDGRKTLDKIKLIEAGVKASVLAGCYTQGKDYVTRTLAKVNKSKES